jgi:hypothetical protein
MTKAIQEKPNYPSKACPQCGTLIHARAKHCKTCGWVMEGDTGGKRRTGRRRSGRPRIAGEPLQTRITLEDLQVVKAAVDRLGAEKVLQLTKVLAK